MVGNSPELGYADWMLQKLRCLLGFHRAVHPFVREKPGVRWWRCGDCGAEFDLPATPLPAGIVRAPCRVVVALYRAGDRLEATAARARGAK
jgi:hypothetical protein